MTINQGGKRPRILDLFCGAGGAAMGLYRAGFEVVGVDIKPQPHYPFEFHQANAMTYPLEGFDAYWASPPCQAYSMAGHQWRSAGKEYPDLVAPTRERLKGKDYIMENVPGAPLINAVVLNGSMFGMRIRRTRLFETSFPMPLVLRPSEERSSFRMGRPVKEGDIVTPVGHFSNVPYVKRQMDIDWMSQSELAQAIPPAYSEYLGKYLLKAILDYEGGLM
jgi:DNA (cytosine-5)-methyltransferase 1